ncbi:hypothetical protein IQ244_17920 [Nostoc sp. LEGE 06077]|uniref:hypothetical protein n=1 Tax=Nostoc sp. LEGE 06077 TaxID=915325 RepID=UPI0018809C13|nr:hypothetical protein [Nostoc sp. LEGE 06077]MBE9208373.1 hypothetical protein [Nostoc sp. LEGE 06077]
MFGFIKNLIGGILGFFTGLLGGKKKKNGGYYLQLDENGAEVTPAPAPKAAPAGTSNGTKATAKAPEPAKKPAPTAKAAKVESSKNGKAAPTEPAKAPAVVAVKKEPTEKTFAPKYLTPAATNGRRRPGANMSSFLDMASQVKTPNQA